MFGFEELVSAFSILILFFRLAMLTATRKTGFSSAAEANAPKSLNEILVQADFQNISSYINSDVSGVISAKRRHLDLLLDVFSKDNLPSRTVADDAIEWPSDQVSQSIPLLLPLTVGIEFEQKSFEAAPSRRSLVVNVDSIAAMVGVQDVHFIQSIAKKLSQRSDRKNHESAIGFDVVFHAERLGLGLRKEGNKIIVDNVDPQGDNKFIRSGDVVRAVNGVVISDTTEINQMKERLALEPRPLVVTFLRAEAKVDGGIETTSPANATNDDGHGKFYSIDVAISTATLTLMEKEVRLFRGCASGIGVGCRIEQTTRSHYHVNISSVLSIDYYNLRIWCWEPLLEPAGLFLKAEHLDAYQGPKELSIEFGDRPKGPISFNVTDAAAETISKFLTWRERVSSNQALYGSLQSQQEVEMDDLVSLETGDAALLFAKRQKSGMKPFIFRNRTGLSVAVAQQGRAGPGKRNAAASFVAVGDYFGLEDFAESDITVVANGEEAKLQIDIDSTAQDSDGVGRFPEILVSFQAVADVVLAPLRDLEIFRPGEFNLPLVVARGNVSSYASESQWGLWASWIVEPVSDGKTVLTLGSSVRVITGLQDSLELSVAFEGDNEDRKIQSIGTARVGEVIYLPVWLAMQPRKWACFASPASGYKYSLIMKTSPSGTVEPVAEKYVECFPKDGRFPTIFFAVSHDLVDSNGSATLFVTINCAVALRNFLPTGLHWEIASTFDHEMVDFCMHRPNEPRQRMLASGCREEVFCRGHSWLALRIRPDEQSGWSNWVELCVPATKAAGEFPNPTVRQAMMVDIFGLTLTVAVRLTPRMSGIDVTVYTDLWFSNCTSLPLVFGSVQDRCAGGNGLFPDSQGESSQFSAAESALKEISSLFETGDEGKGISPPNAEWTGSDIFRLPAQVAPAIMEEVFEYVQVSASGTKRRWWATENPLCARDDPTVIDDSECNWNWLEKAWVSIRNGKVRNSYFVVTTSHK